MLKKAISNKNVLDAKFNAAEFEGEWLRAFGKPDLCGSIIIYGKSGSGKTRFMLRFAKYLSKFKKVAINPLEQGLSLSFQHAWKQEKMEEAGRNVIVLQKEQIPELRLRLSKKKAPDIIFIDSVMCLVGFNRKEYLKLMADFPDKLFIFIAHEKAGAPDPTVAQVILKLSDIKIRVEGFIGFIITRYKDEGNGWGVDNFTIWDKGASEYWATNL